MKWIKNVLHSEAVMQDGRMVGRQGHSICVTCGKRMPVCWDTACYYCGDTSCYDHSIERDGKWLCLKCANKNHDANQA